MMISVSIKYAIIFLSETVRAGFIGPYILHYLICRPVLALYKTQKN